MKFKALMVVLAAAMLASVPAFATCTDNNSTEFCLDTPNQGPLNVGDIVVKVTYDGDKLTVAIDSFNGFTDLDIKAVGINDGTANQYFANGDPNAFWTAPAPGGSCCDGFDGALGPFNSTTQGNEAGAQSSVTFDLVGNPDLTGATFAVHVGYNNNGVGCSVWLTNGTFTPGPSEHPECGGTTEVPEPGSLALLGTGLFSAVGVLRRKLLKA